MITTTPEVNPSQIFTNELIQPTVTKPTDNSTLFRDSSQRKNRANNLGLIFGLVFGLLLFILAVILIVFYLRYALFNYGLIYATMKVYSPTLPLTLIIRHYPEISYLKGTKILSHNNFDCVFQSVVIDVVNAETFYSQVADTAFVLF